MVERVVSSQVKCLSLKDSLTLVDLERILQDIHHAVDLELEQQFNGSITGFLLPPSVNTPVKYFIFVTNYLIRLAGVFFDAS